MIDNDKEILDSYKKGETPAFVFQNIQPKKIKEIHKIQPEERYAIKAEILSDVLDAIVYALNGRRYNPLGIEIGALTPRETLESVCSFLNEKIRTYEEKRTGE